MSAGAAARGSAAPARAPARARALDPAELAWLALLPCALVTLLAIVLLGPPLGHAFFAPGGDRFWDGIPTNPEPVEHARFLLALGGPVIAVGAVLMVLRRSPRLRPGTARALVLAGQVGTFAFLVLALLAQNDILMRGYRPPVHPTPLFTAPTLAAAALLAIGAAGLLRRPSLVAAAVRVARETRARRVACLAIAGVLVLVWLLSAFNTEGSIGLADGNNLIPWDMNETFAVLDGRTPLVDFHSQYAQLLPYLFAGVLRVVGTSVAAWTATMIAFSAAALLAVYAILRRVVGSSPLALALFVPFLATSAFLVGGGLSPLEVFSLWPMRYGPPYALAWLLVRHLDGARPRSRPLLLAAGAAVAINNLEFGLPAFGGALAALAFARPPRTRAAALLLGRDACIGLVGAAAGVCALSLAHGGALPRFGLLLEFPRIYAIGGWVLERMAPVGFHLAMYATFVAAIVVASVRAVRDDAPDRALTGMLVWSGVFGLGAGSYYAGRSDPLDLISLFSAWCLALVLLAVVVVRGLAGARRRPTLPELAVLFGIGLVACSIWQMPRPWAEIARVRHTTRAVYKQPEAIRLVRRTAAAGEKVAIFIPLGDRIAYDAGVDDVLPYSSSESMPTVAQMRTALAVMRRMHVTRVYVDLDAMVIGQMRALAAAGYAPAVVSGRIGMLEQHP